MLFGDKKAPKRHQAGAITICFPGDMATKTMRNAIWRQKGTRRVRLPYVFLAIWQRKGCEMQTQPISIKKELKNHIKNSLN